jgi:uncharacterized protein
MQSGELNTLTAFVRLLRERGVRIPVDAATEFVLALDLLGMSDLYAAGRATLVRRFEDLATYDAAFLDFFADVDEQTSVGAPEPSTPPGSESTDEVPEDQTGDVTGEGGEAEEEDAEVGAASAIILLREKRFADCSEAELESIRELMHDLTLVPPRRRTRRYVSASRGQLDARRTFRAALRTGGDPVKRPRRVRAWTERRVVLMLDVSASMNPYSRALLMFAHVALRHHPDLEVFCFGTRLTRLTNALGRAHPDEAFAAVADVAYDRGAGTMIGASVQEFLKEYRSAKWARGAVIVFCSDGLETGDPTSLGMSMQRLRRLAHRIIWLNPLKEDARYEPLARGMAAALPAIDVLASGHNLRSLEELASLLASSFEPAGPGTLIANPAQRGG